MRTLEKSAINFLIADGRNRGCKRPAQAGEERTGGCAGRAHQVVINN
jgi:hypothetical protein